MSYLDMKVFAFIGILILTLTFAISLIVQTIIEHIQDNKKTRAKHSGRVSGIK